MHFNRESKEKIIANLKWVTRRRNRPRFEVGSIQPMQCGYRDKAFGYCIIISIRQERLSDMTNAEIIAEGCRPGTLEEWKRVWNDIYGVYDGDLEVWRIEFKPSMSKVEAMEALTQQTKLMLTKEINP